MRFTAEDQAINVLDDNSNAYWKRESAARFLSEHPTDRAIEHLVHALQDDNFGVRWEAAVTLTRLGEAALPELLTALADPHRVGDSRLREGVYHVLHYSHAPKMPVPIDGLMEALKGPAADIATLEEANRLLDMLKKQPAKKTESPAGVHPN